MKTHQKLVILVLLFSFTKSFSQLDLSHEVGIVAGPLSMQTDYGERNNFPSSNQSTFGIAIVHYLSFFGSNYNWRNGATWFSDHFKLRSEFSYYFNNSLEHKGRYVEDNSAFADRLRAMQGETKIYNFGMQLEYYFKNLEDYGLLFNTADKFAPYISAGIQYSRFDAGLTNTPSGTLDVASLPEKWQNRTFLEPDNTFSLTLSGGTRFKLDNVDLVADVRWQYFFSDRVDGLDQVDGSSKYNDTLIFFSVGVIFDLSNLSR